MQKEVAVAILNWNGYDHLKRYLPSVIQFADNYTIYVIDNQSSDESISLLKNDFPEVKIIQNSENGGYAKGYNDGLKSIEEEFLVSSSLNFSKSFGPPT